MPMPKATWLVLSVAIVAVFSISCSKTKQASSQDAPAVSAPAPDPFAVADSAGLAKSQDLNGQGYEIYTKGDYVGAAKLFAQAIQANRRNDTAWYNEACSLSLARVKDPEAARLSDILDDLENSLKLNSGRAAKLKTDTDLSSLRDDQYFKILVERFNGQATPVLLSLKSINSFEGDVSFVFKDKENERELIFDIGESPREELVNAGLIKEEGGRYVPIEVKPDMRFFAHYKEVSGPSPSSEAGEPAPVTTHPVLIDLEDAGGFDQGD